MTDSHDPYARTQMGRFAHITAVHAGVGNPSTSQMLAERLADATRDAFAARSRIASVHVVSLRDFAQDITGAALGGVPRGDLADLLDDLARTDGLIAVSPVFQASYTGLFKSFLDILPEGTLRGAPVLLGATAGTARHSLVPDVAMRPVFTHLKAAVVPTSVFAASEDFGASWAEAGTADEHPLAHRIARAGEELADWIDRFPRQAPADPLADFTPMEELLGPRGR